MENVKHTQSSSMNIFFSDIIQNTNLFKSISSGLLCFVANFFLVDISIVLSTGTYLFSFVGAGMALYNSYLTISIKKEQLRQQNQKKE